MALDLLIRHETKNKKSLDDVMRLLYKRYVEEEPRAYTYDDFREICETISGGKLSDFFTNYVDGTEEIDFRKYLGYAGYELLPDTSRLTQSINLGMKWRPSNGNLIVSQVVSESPAYYSGINVNDELMAMGRYRLNESNMNTIIEMMKGEDSVALTVSRDGILRRLTLEFRDWFRPRYRLTLKEKPSSLEEKIAKSWLFEDGQK